MVKYNQDITPKYFSIEFVGDKKVYHTYLYIFLGAIRINVKSNFSYEI